MEVLVGYSVQLATLPTHRLFASYMGSAGQTVDFGRLTSDQPASGKQCLNLAITNEMTGLPAPHVIVYKHARHDVNVF